MGNRLEGKVAIVTADIIAKPYNATRGLRMDAGIQMMLGHPVAGTSLNAYGRADAR